MDGKCKCCGGYNFKAVIQGCKVIEARCQQCGHMADTTGMNPHALIGPAHSMMNEVITLKRFEELKKEEISAAIFRIESFGCFLLSEIHRYIR